MYLVAWCLLRHIDDMSTWIENFLNLEYDQPTEADRNWHRLLANIIGAGGILLSIHAMIMLTIKNFQERNKQSDTKTATSDKHTVDNEG